MDQLYYHGEIYTAIFEKTTRLLGYILVFLGVKLWFDKYKLLNEKLSIKAITDDLTGLFNRRGILNQLENLSQQTKYKKTSLSIISIDFDDFKKVNDRFGHMIGGKVLRIVGQSLLNFLSESQKIGRWGGEEFAIAELNSNSAQAAELCETIQQHISKLILPDVMGNYPVTLSFGVSELQGNEDYFEVIQRADRALYQSKNTGKNRVSIL